MKKIVIYAIIILIIFVLFELSPKVYKYYTPIRSMTPYKTAQHDDDTLRIAYIGDSWAYLHQEQEQCQIPQMIESQTGHPTKVYSYGLGGRTSNEIYEALFADKCFRRMIQKNGADYCFISAGINDVNKKMSIEYYQKSMDNIICFMLANNIRPVILEIPDFDAQKVFRWLKNSRKLLRKLSMAINGVPMDCKQMYRKALDSLIKEKKYQDKVHILRYKTWNNNYQNDQKRLYLRDGVHLNDHGYAVLDSVIAKEIISNL